MNLLFILITVQKKKLNSFSAFRQKRLFHEYVPKCQTLFLPLQFEWNRYMYKEEFVDPPVKVINEEKQGEVYLGNGTTQSDKKFYIESYGCQMNFSDSEIVASILQKEGYSATDNIIESSLVLVNTCSIREKAEETVRKRLEYFKSVKKHNPAMLVGVLGCMAERMKKTLLEQEQLVDMVVGPDAYRDLPVLLAKADGGERQINVLLSREETYADISPVRLESNGVTAFISIMRGCNNMCSFCVVPYTRGRERSRDAYSIIAEASDLFDRGYREVTLLGQNVDSYNWTDPTSRQTINFADLLKMTAEINPLLRIRFSTSHPKDITDEVMHVMSQFDNICKYIHLPVQSGSNRILELMNRTYTADWYRDKIKRIYEYMPDCAISSDIIAGFCSETEEDHQASLAMIPFVRYSMSYMFIYSERPGTPAARKLQDDVPLDVKNRRLSEIIETQRRVSLEHNTRDIGKTFEVLVEGFSKKSASQLKGRNSQNKMIVFDAVAGTKAGDYVKVTVDNCTSATLLGQMVK